VEDIRTFQFDIDLFPRSDIGEEHQPVATGSLRDSAAIDLHPFDVALAGVEKV
jgi:hypothetical protein